MPLIKTITPSSFSDPTGVSIEEQGLTYNQAGYTYNDSRAFYGGLYGKNIVFTGKTTIITITPK